MADRPLELGWLRVIAEVGRAGNLTTAAERLRLTQPGVSYQIRRIEEELGVALLRRHHRGVDLTDEGQRLYELAARHVAEIDRLAQDIRGRREQPTIRLHTDYAFSSMWLMPRMQDFRARHQEINLQIVATQNPLGQAAGDEDVTVAFGTKAQAGGDAVLLLSERVTPVCAADYAAGPDVDTLTRARLIHLDSTSPSWFDWSAYFARFGLRRDADRTSGDISFNTYSLVIQAAIAEQGITLGWTGLVDDMLASGALKTIGPTVEAPDRGYWLVAPRRDAPAEQRLVDWLLAQ
jgi:putative choline sulfate-utilization transcription factor